MNILITGSAQGIGAALVGKIISLGGRAVAVDLNGDKLRETMAPYGDRVLSREQIEQHLYKWGSEVSSNAVEVHIHNLRRKLGAALIETIRGVGYVARK